jgi:dipicolinate synthase subunit B
MSFNAATITSRFGRAKDNIRILEEICGKKVIQTIEDAEPLGPKGITDRMLICPCTGNTLAKLAANIIDTPVTMAVKSHLRNSKPVYIALSTNDGLSGSYANIAKLQNTKNYVFVDYKQDDAVNKPYSLSFDEENLFKVLSSTP